MQCLAEQIPPTDLDSFILSSELWWGELHLEHYNWFILIFPFRCWKSVIPIPLRVRQCPGVRSWDFVLWHLLLRFFFFLKWKCKLVCPRWNKKKQFNSNIWKLQLAYKRPISMTWLKISPKEAVSLEQIAISFSTYTHNRIWTWNRSLQRKISAE